MTSTHLPSTHLPSTHLPIDAVKHESCDLVLVTLAVAGRELVCVAGEPVGEHLAVTPALACTPTDTAVRYAGDTWTVTHRLSGRAVRYIYCSIQHARAAAGYLADNIDWTRPLTHLVADPAVRDIINAADRCRTELEHPTR